MPTVRLPIGTRRQSMLFMFIDFLIDIFRNPEYKLHRRIIILSVFVFGYILLIFPYQTMTIGLIGLSIYILQVICDVIKNSDIRNSGNIDNTYEKGMIYVYNKDEETYEYKLDDEATYKSNIRDNFI